MGDTGHVNTNPISSPDSQRGLRPRLGKGFEPSILPRKWLGASGLRRGITCYSDFTCAGMLDFMLMFADL